MTRCIYLTDHRIIIRPIAQALFSGDKKFPSRYNLQYKCPLPYDQGHISSSSANAFCTAYKIMAGGEPSRLYFDYYNKLVDGPSYIKQVGICSEELWPHKKENRGKQPPPQCTMEAVNHRISSYKLLAIDDNIVLAIKSYLTQGIPLIITIGAYQSLESTFTSRTGVIKLPKESDEYLGDHMMCLIGYNNITQLFIVLNSWGQTWGDRGYGYLPYSYLTNPNLCRECAIITVA